ncbi:hypothetical protein AB0O52_18500 [Arthrobacter sp. NPDC080073]|uniref:hypothetical protein n=1 Tax=Arthrobacter sp. NPDC080073 TaxID=3155919 RepID=UPI0034316343
MEVQGPYLPYIHEPVGDTEHLDNLVASELSMGFTVDADTGWRLLNGLDVIDLTLQDQGPISAFEMPGPLGFR